MFGHVHTDIYKLVGSVEDSEDPIGVLQVCGAITTLLGNNPAYCVYELDKATMLPVSRKTYYFDMDSANETGVPDWKLMTDWTADFDLIDLSPASLKKHADKMVTDSAFSADFLNRSKRITDGSPTCSESCRKNTVCSARFIDPYSTA